MGQFGIKGSEQGQLIRDAKQAEDWRGFQEEGNEIGRRRPIDLMAQMIDSSPSTYASLLRSWGGESAGKEDTASLLFNRLHQGGLLNPPAKHDPKVIEAAKAQWDSMHGEQEREPGGDEREPDEPAREPQEDIPFSAIAAGVRPEVYAAIMADIERYAFDPKQHPRGQPENKGEFAEKEGRGSSAAAVQPNELTRKEERKPKTRENQKADKPLDSLSRDQLASALNKKLKQRGAKLKYYAGSEGSLYYKVVSDDENEAVLFDKIRVSDHAARPNDHMTPDFDFVEETPDVPADIAILLEQVDDELRSYHKEQASNANHTAPAKPTRPHVTETPEFKRWFGKSAVVDKDGKPLRVFHGTKGGDFEEFKETGPSRERWGNRGHYFTANPEYAGDYATQGAAENSRTVPVYLRIENPKVLPERQTSLITDAQFREFTAAGHDGVIGVDKAGKPVEFVAFDAKQIKSATGNKGTFDPADPRINYSAASSPGIKYEIAAALMIQREIEQYAARKVKSQAGQASLWGPEQEAQHPRDAVGEFTAKGEGSVKPAEKEPEKMKEKVSSETGQQPKDSLESLDTGSTSPPEKPEGRKMTGKIESDVGALKKVVIPKADVAALDKANRPKSPYRITLHMAGWRQVGDNWEKSMLTQENADAELAKLGEILGVSPPAPAEAVKAEAKAEPSAEPKAEEKVKASKEEPTTDVVGELRRKIEAIIESGISRDQRAVALGDALKGVSDEDAVEVGKQLQLPDVFGAYSLRQAAGRSAAIREMVARDDKAGLGIQPDKPIKAKRLPKFSPNAIHFVTPERAVKLAGNSGKLRATAPGEVLAIIDRPQELPRGGGFAEYEKGDVLRLGPVAYVVQASKPGFVRRGSGDDDWQREEQVVIVRKATNMDLKAIEGDAAIQEREAKAVIDRAMAS
jgi:hypothetical protein